MDSTLNPLIRLCLHGYVYNINKVYDFCRGLQSYKDAFKKEETLIRGNLETINKLVPKLIDDCNKYYIVVLNNTYSLCWFRSVILSWMYPKEIRCNYTITNVEAFKPIINKIIDNIIKDTCITIADDEIKSLLAFLINYKPPVEETGIYGAYFMFLCRALHLFNSTSYPNPGYFGDYLSSWYAKRLLNDFVLFDKSIFIDKLDKESKNEFTKDYNIIVVKLRHYEPLLRNIGNYTVCSLALVDYGFRLTGGHMISFYWCLDNNKGYVCDEKWTLEKKLKLRYKNADNNITTHTYCKTTGEIRMNSRSFKHFKFNINKGQRIVTYVRRTVSTSVEPIKNEVLITDFNHLLSCIEDRCHFCNLILIYTNQTTIAELKLEYLMTVEGTTTIRKLIIGAYRMKQEFTPGKSETRSYFDARAKEYITDEITSLSEAVKLSNDVVKGLNTGQTIIKTIETKPFDIVFTTTRPAGGNQSKVKLLKGGRQQSYAAKLLQQTKQLKQLAITTGGGRRLHKHSPSYV